MGSIDDRLRLRFDDDVSTSLRRRAFVERRVRGASVPCSDRASSSSESLKSARDAAFAAGYASLGLKTA